MQALQGDARVMKGEISRFTRLTDPRQMRRRKGENRVHHKGMRGGNAQEPGSVRLWVRVTPLREGEKEEDVLWHHIRPGGEARGSASKHLIGNGGEVVDKAEVSFGENAPLGLGVDSEFGERKVAGLAPKLNGSINFRRPEKIRLLR